MSNVKSQLDALLWDIYGRQHHAERRCKRLRYGYPCLRLKPSDQDDIRKLNDMDVLLQDEIRLMACFLKQALVERDQNRCHQKRLCEYVTGILCALTDDDVHPKMRFSLTPPPPKAIHTSTISTATATTRWNSSSSNSRTSCSSAASNSDDYHHQYQPNNNNNYNNSSNGSSNNCDKYKMQRQEDTNSNKPPTATQSEEESTSDYKQWLHAMKLVARLPGGIPPEFRRKLWLSLADKYLKSKNIDWSKEEEKCFCEKWREDDEELGIQIVKDLHRTGSTLCTGPAGDVNQAKLKRILLGYARYNPEVGYCQGFNMLGALILQVMDKEEAESMKVMIYLVEGILPPGYFCGSMGGLQADMAVFRELMQTKLPRLARHLQKLQGPVENAYEPPLTNVFTMQWFLTMFCTCLPMSCVLRVWDLVLIEGSDVLLRTALALWSLLEERVLSTRSADDFYGKMGSFSGELLNGHLIDSNGLIEKVVQLGPIQDIQKLRDKHLYSVAPLQNKQGLNFYYDDEEPDMDEDSRLAVATVWGIPWGRRGSQGTSATTIAKQAVESKDRIALDISLLKKQYDRLRERQKQAHIILTTACSTARQSTGSSAVTATLPVNQLLSGRPAIITNRGRRTGPPTGAIPPARKPSLPAVLQDKPLEKQLRRGETLQWRDSIHDSKRRRDSLTWKEIRAERAAMISSGSIDGLKSQKIRTKRLGKSDSSSYSEESEEDDVNDKAAASSSDTSHCDDDNQPLTSGRKYVSNLKNNAKSKVLMKQKKFATNALDNGDRQRPKSWAPSNSDIPFVLMTADSPNNSADEGAVKTRIPDAYVELTKEEENSATESDQIQINGSAWHSIQQYSPLSGDLVLPKVEPLLIHTDLSIKPASSEIIHTTPPVTDVTEILAITKALNPPKKTHLTESTNSLGSGDGDGESDDVKVSDEGVTNEYFERVNSTERPTKLELMYSLNEEDTIRDAYKDNADVVVVEVECPPAANDVATKENQSRCMDLLVDYSEKSSAACIAEAKTEISTNLQMSDYSNKTEHNTAFSTSAASKRRDPRRLTLTRSSTMEIEKRYQALEKRLSMEVSSKHKTGPSENPSETSKYRSSYHAHTKSPSKEEEDSQPVQHRIPYPLSSIYSDEVRETSNPLDFPQQRKHIIPSTADLEERFENMIRDRSKQVSSVNDSEKGGNTRKTPPSPKQSPRSDTTKNADKRQASKESGNTTASKNVGAQDDATSKEIHTERDTEDTHDIDRDNDDEDFSDRQTTAERYSESNVSGSSSLRRKKEPPDAEKYSDDDNESRYAGERESVQMRSVDGDDDDAEYIASDEEVDRSLTVSGHDSPEVDSEPEMAYDEDDIEERMPTSRRQSELESEPAEHTTTSRRHSEISPEHSRQSTTSRMQSEIASTSRRQSEMSSSSRRQSALDGRSDKSKGAVAKKSPPSTEELEKRFNALEKQMSISKSEASEEPPEAKVDTSSLEYDDRQSPDGFSEIDQQQIDDESQKSAAGSETADEGLEERSRSNRIKASVIEAMKSSDEGRSNKMVTNVMDAMKSAATRRSDEEESQSRSRSHKMAANVMDAMRSSSGRQSADDQTERGSRADRIKAGVIEAMKSSSNLPSPAEGSETPGRSNKMAANVMEAMQLSARRSDDEDDTEKRSRANRIKANVIEAMKSSSNLPSPAEGSESPSKSNKMAANVMEAMKSSASRQSADENSEKRSRSNKIRAGVIEAMKSTSVQPSPDEDLETPSKSTKVATNVMAAMKSSHRHGDTDEGSQQLSRSDRIKADVIAAMKSSSDHPSPGEATADSSRANKMATNVMEAMKSTARRSDKNDGSESPSRSSRMATNVMEAMKSPARRSDDNESSGKLSRSDRIKADMIAAMKSSSPDEEPQTPSRSTRMATNVMAAMKSSHHRSDVDENATKISRSNKIKADVIEAMKSSTDRHPADDEAQARRSQKIASNVMDTMKSSVRRSPEEGSETRRTNKMASNVMDAMKSSSARHTVDKDSEKIRRSNRIKADVIEAMKSASDSQPAEEGSETRRSNKMATNVMDAMKTAVRHSPQQGLAKTSRSIKMATNVMDAMKSPSVRHSPDESSEKLKRSNKIKADVIEAMKSAHPNEAGSETRRSKMAANVMDAMKASTSRRLADDGQKQKSNKVHDTAAAESSEIVVEATQSSSGRRSSEPPSTEDLEKRYEILKRRMSSKNFETSQGKRGTSEYTSDIDEGTDEPLSSKEDRSVRATPKTSPPSTDSLERRFEKLQSESESGRNKIDDDKRPKEKQTKERSTKREQTGSKQSPTTKENTSNSKAPKDSDSNRRSTAGSAPAQQQQNLEHSPTETSESSVYKSPSQETGGRSALIEELQSKMGATPDGENIKPSSINPNRKPRPPHVHPILRKSKTDETSETHATNANSISGKYEPLHSSNRKMVRRFSDVPSRADLENRLQFLEEKLSKTLFKQRRASDSEVASTSRNHHIKPMSANIRHAGKLESRVRELEKQLSTSSKFVAAVKDKKSSKEPESLTSSQMGLEITADSIDLTGKELVRYSNCGEVDEHDFQSPINISINIHMTLSKEDLGKSATQQLTRADELSRRLLILEQQLKDSQKNIASSSTPTGTHDHEKHVSSDPPTTSHQAQVEEDEVRPEEYVVHVENEKDNLTGELPKERTETANVVNEITPDSISISDPEAKKATQTSSEPVIETPEIIPDPVQPTESLHTSEPVEETKTEPDPPQASEPVARTSINVSEEVVSKDPIKKPDHMPNEQDFDRRLQILEQHMKNSQTMSTSETHAEPSVTSRVTDFKDDCQSLQKSVQSKSETPKTEAEKVTEESSVDPNSKKIDKPTVQSSAKTSEGDGGKTSDSKLDGDLENKIVPSKQPHDTEAQTIDVPADNLSTTQMVPMEVNKKTLVLLLDNEPKAVKVRRLTRANTEELEDLFQALEKQLIERGQVKPEDVDPKGLLQSETTKEMEMKMAHLTKEIMELSKSVKTEEHLVPVSSKAARREEDFDWGLDPIKHHLKKKTAYLPSTRELEARFRSLERQIKQLEDVEKIDVEQRLTEIERKIKLQYSLSHEKDLNKFLDLCEGKGLDDTPPAEETPVAERREYSHAHSDHSHCAHAKKHQSPVRMIEPERVECSHSHSSHSHSAAAKQHQSPVRAMDSKSSVKPTTEDLEYRFRALDLKKSSRPKPCAEMKREPIHPLEMLLDPSPEDIPTTGELEHRMRMLEEGRDTPSPTSRKSRSKSPVAAGESRPPLPTYESPSPSGLPTAQELEARLAALEKEHRFDFKMQKNYKQFNQKLKDIISPISPTFEEFKATRSSSAESATHKNVHRSPSPKVRVGCAGDATCSRTIRFHEDEQHRRPRSRNDSESMVSTNNDVIQILEENSNMIQRILKKTIADSHGGCVNVPAHLASSVQEGLGVMGIRLMRETSPLRRKGTHTGVPLRTGENINDQLTSIKNTIKSIDSLCEEKPYRTERCQQYIDSLCSDSTYFASKKSSLDDLTSRHLSRSRSREYGGPSIRISDHSPAFTRSMGSADSIRSSSPLRPTSPLQYHSNRDLRREISPRRRRDEEREENESRVRRDNLLPNIYNTYNHSSLSQSSHSLTKFHKVDRQLISNDVDDIDVELQQTYRQPTTFSSNETTSIHDSNTNTSNTANNTRTTLTNVVPNTNITNDTTTFKGSILDKPNSPYRQIGLARSNTPVYTPAKLEIRHTTVTSTFYDRVLTEKQLEKKHSTTNIIATTTTTNTTTSVNVPASRSPLLEQPPVVRPTDKYSPPNFPYPDMAAYTYSAASGDPDTAAATTVVANQVKTWNTTTKVDH